MKCRRNPFWLLSPAESYNDGGRINPCYNDCTYYKETVIFDNLLLLPKQQLVPCNL